MGKISILGGGGQGGGGEEKVGNHSISPKGSGVLPEGGGTRSLGSKGRGERPFKRGEKSNNVCLVGKGEGSPLPVRGS